MNLVHVHLIHLKLWWIVSDLLSVSIGWDTSTCWIGKTLLSLPLLSHLILCRLILQSLYCLALINLWFIKNTIRSHIVVLSVVCCLDNWFLLNCHLRSILQEILNFWQFTWFLIWSYFTVVFRHFVWLPNFWINLSLLKLIDDLLLRWWKQISNLKYICFVQSDGSWILFISLLLHMIKNQFLDIKREITEVNLLCPTFAINSRMFLVSFV